MVHRTPFILPLLYPSLIWRMPSDGKELFLTFDDGPVPGPTEFVLDTLQQYNITATFFCIGDNIRKYPAVFKEIAHAGHKIGNHTHNHLNGWKTSNSSYIDNVEECNKQISEHLPDILGPATIFRPPYGRITRNQIRSLDKYRIIMWDVLAIDYNDGLSSRPGSIIVFHDSYKAEKNLTFVLPKYIEHFLTLGFEFKVVPG
jgi:peptidoglycan/xylan/chitin deacetylase (PgdA/CDA1 family)